MNSQHAKQTVTLDRYSRFILTIISVCLIFIVINLYFSPQQLHAVQSVQDVNLKSINGYSISGGYLPVDIQRIDGSSSKNLNVDIKSINGRNVYGDKLPVDIQSVNGQFFIGGYLPVVVK
jgi:hypothetical protein